MKLSRFKFVVTFLSLLVSVVGFLAVASLFTNHLWVTRITLAGLWLFLVVSLIRFVNRTNRKLDAFLQSLKYLDNVTESLGMGKDFSDLNTTFNSIINNIKSVHRTKEAQGHYFRNTVEHVNIGILSFDANGRVGMINKAARDIFDLSGLENISSLREINKDLPGQLLDLQPGDDGLVSITAGGHLRRLVLRSADLAILGEKLKIVSLQDIHLQLEDEELDTWQRLIAVLRHEIMNSVAPLNSLSYSLRKLSDKIKGVENKLVVRDINEGLDAISGRSAGLINFVEAYRSLTKIPAPRFTVFRLKDLLDEVSVLYKPEMNQRGIAFALEMQDESLEMPGDYNLLSQVLINLIRNALDALSNSSGRIGILARKDSDGSVLISVKDNGQGIGPNELNNIFTPFYTTRDGGSGIGLSLVRQIMRMHKATVSVISEPDKGSEFTLRF